MKFKLIVVMTEDDLTSRAIETARAHGETGCTVITNARGEGLKPTKTFLGLTYDSGGVTTSTITVPLVTALGVGLASVIQGRNPMIEGFGLIAFASLMPIIFVLLFGLGTGAWA
jgi:hypothetical protein